MTKLEMHKKLQPLYKKMMMNGWKVGDRYYNTVAKKYAIILSEAWWPEYDHAIRIPLPIDPVNPKRGLWGMVDWNRYSCWLYGGKISIHSKDREEIEPRYLDPETALLMALLEQEKL